MPYIGNSLATQFQAFATQTITGDGSTGYTLDRGVVNGKELLVYINNVKQEEGAGKSYTASGTTITFSAAVASTDSCYLVYLGSAVQTVNPPDASVGTTQLASGAVTSAKLANANLEMPNTLDMNGNELILDADADTSIQAGSDDTMVFDTAGSERMRIDSSGNVLVGKTATGTSNTGCQFEGSGTGVFSRSGDICMVLNRETNAGECVSIRQGGTAVGGIDANSSSVDFNTSSDYRLKENETTSWNATTRLKQLKPVRFSWKKESKSDADTDGFLAHEVSSVVPQAISGEKDAVDADGNPKHQGIDHSKLVALLVKTVQELEARIATLESK